MAIARRLPEDIEPVLFTLSQAAPAVVEAGLPGRVLPLLPPARLGLGLAVEPAPAPPARAAARRRASRPGRLRRGPPLPGADPRAHRLGRAALGLVPAADVAARVRRPRRWSGRAPSTRCSSPASSPPSADAGPDRRAPRRGDPRSTRSSTSIPTSCSAARRAARELGLDPERTTALVNLGQGGATDAPSRGSSSASPPSPTCRWRRCSRASAAASRSPRASSCSTRPSR